MALFLCIATMTAALVFGGGTRNGFLSDVIVQLLAVVLLVYAIYTHASLPADRRRIWPLAFAAAAVLIPALQLIPLPAGLWKSLPNRAMVAEGLEIVGAMTSAMPLSLTPRETWLAALSLIPPAAMFLGVLLLTYRERRTLSIVVLAIGMISVVIGFLQIAQGEDSPLRFFEFTNTREAVGFFANRNHFAAFIYVLVLLAGAWILSLAAPVANDGSTRSRESVGVFYLFVGVLALTVLIAGQAVTRSRAGMGLTILSLFALVLLARRPDTQTSAASPSMRGVLVAVGLGLLLVAQFALVRLLERFADPRDALTDTRTGVWKSTIEAAVSYMPWGTGLGSFLSVYPAFERPADVVIGTYMNRAHNDYLEFWLEAGIFAPAVLAVFFVCLIDRTLKLWQHSVDHVLAIDVYLARAAAIGIILVSIHSIVDYPLRTAALAVCFAFCCALLVAPILTEDAAKKAVVATRPASNPNRPAMIEPVDLSRTTQASGSAAPAPVVWPAYSDPQEAGAALQEPGKQAGEHADWSTTAGTVVGGVSRRPRDASGQDWPGAWTDRDPPGKSKK